MSTYNTCFIKLKIMYSKVKDFNTERSGSVVGFWTRDQGVVGSSLTGINALCP